MDWLNDVIPGVDQTGKDLKTYLKVTMWAQIIIAALLIMNKRR